MVDRTGGGTAQRLKLLLSYLDEDAGRGDITTEALRIKAGCTAEIVAKRACVLAGTDAAAILLKHFKIKYKLHKRDGTACAGGDVVLELEGDGAAILKLERLILNLLGRMSGIATGTRELVDNVRSVNPSCLVAATRKTTPGFRVFEKDAVAIGGGHPHRFDLADAVMIKDNHLKFIEDPAKAVELAAGQIRRLKTTTALRYGRGRPGHRQKWIELEAEDIETAVRAVKAGADIVMLDNMSPEQVKAAYVRLKSIRPTVKIEVSGGINPDNIMAYAPYADIISLGWLTHSVRSADFSMSIVEVL